MAAGSIQKGAPDTAIGIGQVAAVHEAEVLYRIDGGGGAHGIGGVRATGVVSGRVDWVIRGLIEFMRSALSWSLKGSFQLLRFASEGQK
ncbi:MAG: hypothetical protein ACREO0_07305 [Pseudoxanthomonas sp.]